MTGPLSGPVVALAFAVAGAIGYGFAAILEAVGAHRTPGTAGTLRSPVYLAGVALDLLAWLASLVALRFLPVYQVQAVLAASLAITVLLARLLLGARLRAVDLVAVGVTVVAVTVLAASSGPALPARPPRAGDPVALTVGLAAVPVLVAGWAAVRWAGPPALSAALAGLAYGGTALCARLIRWPADPWPRLAEDPLPWALAGYAVTGTLLYAYALEHGSVGPVTAVLWIVEVTVPSAVGWVVLGDPVRAGWVPAALTAFAAVVAAAAVLAYAPAYGVSQVTAGTAARGSAPD